MLPDLHRQLQTLRPLLLRFAALQLCNAAQAEDVVQDALIAVMEKPERFAGQSSLRTYVTGIMKYKIIDALRAAGRMRQIDPRTTSRTPMLLMPCLPPTAMPCRRRALRRSDAADPARHAAPVP